ncbi:DUF3019 domain-containing protein [Pseudoalteromonas sp. SSDWG2]|uniref:DUF3019 domain-containing protein n=1 Tax=Pseudoalteromonas sp. SSDWG2 TaxID=3139391 RepID=UPI003BAB0E7B
MSFKLWAALAVSCLGTVSQAQAKESITQNAAPEQVPESLLSTPNTCVALRQGRTCYSDITFAWQVSNEGHFCIRQQSQNSPLHCWNNIKQGEVTVDFASATAQIYEMVNMQTQQVVAQSEVKVQWVYTSKQKKRRWRLF